jgi:ribose/xylose/arabinose/galactoside ABC-type transport system permease subunit
MYVCIFVYTRELRVLRRRSVFLTTKRGVRVIFSCDSFKSFHIHMLIYLCVRMCVWIYVWLLGVLWYNFDGFGRKLFDLGVVKAWTTSD